MKFWLPVFVCALLFPAVSLHAEEGESQALGVKTGLRGTVGTGGYLGRGASLQYGDDWVLRGSYSDYRYDGSTGTTRTAGLHASYQGENLAAGISASVTPRNDSYANRSFGVDGSWTFLLDDSKEPAGLEEFELGAWWTQTRHSQIVPAANPRQIDRETVINQHDLGLSASLTAWHVTLSLDASRSIYDQDFYALPAAIRRIPRLAETISLIRSFPERSGSARLEYGRWRACVPYISAVASRYEIQPQPASLTTGAGVALRFGGLSVDLGYELSRQKGSTDTKYFNFGGSYRF